MYKSNNEMYSTFTKAFRWVIDKHAPLKVKKVRGKQGPLIKKELSKAIMNKSRIRNISIKNGRLGKAFWPWKKHKSFAIY